MRDLLDEREFFLFMYDFRDSAPIEVKDKLEAVKDFIRFHCIVPGSVVNEEED